jgi:hypothetical protein
MKMAKPPVATAKPDPSPCASDQEPLDRLIVIVEKMREATVHAALSLDVDDVDVYAEAIVHLAAVAAHRSGRPLVEYELLLRATYNALDEVLSQGPDA